MAELTKFIISFTQIQRSVKSNPADYQSNQHRGMSVGPPKSAEKGQQIKPDPSVVAYPIYGYNYQQPYHKDLKVRTIFCVCVDHGCKIHIILDRLVGKI